MSHSQPAGLLCEIIDLITALRSKFEYSCWVQCKSMHDLFRLEALDRYLRDLEAQGRI